MPKFARKSSLLSHESKRGYEPFDVAGLYDRLLSLSVDLYPDVTQSGWKLGLRKKAQVKTAGYKAA
jgi:hypothetical protein